MWNVALPLLLGLLGADDPAVSSATLLSYRGTIERRTDDSGKTRKTFDVVYWMPKAGSEGAEVCWSVDERGRGEWPWTERFGRFAVDPQWHTSQKGAALLYDRGEARSVVPLVPPFLTNEKPLAAGVTWQDDKLVFNVEKPEKLMDREVWQISMSDPYGQKGLLSLDRHSPLVVSALERVTMGRGEEYQMKWELIGQERLSAERAALVTAAFDGLLALRSKLNLPAQTQEVAWKEEQLALLQTQLPQVIKAAEGTPLAKTAAAAARDLALQEGRKNALADLSGKYTGLPVEKFSIPDLAGKMLSEEALAGHVTVLHFWEYRDEPLKEPYGQVGYLDFLYQHRKPEGLQVYGVAVDGRLADEKTRPAAERSVKKLKAFMNLSYPLLLDSGPLVKQFGDPRLLGASLPLFVVVGRDGTIVHYHVGHHKVQQEQGLRELDRIVGAELSKK